MKNLKRQAIKKAIEHIVCNADDTIWVSNDEMTTTLVSALVDIYIEDFDGSDVIIDYVEQITEKAVAESSGNTSVDLFDVESE